jgi:general secretion pathway protein G
MSSHRNGRCAAKASSAGGFILVDLIVSAIILLTLCGMAQPLAAFAIRREKERILRHNLRPIREAIDRYQEGSLAGKFLKAPSYGYPPNLQALMDPIELSNGSKLRILREIPPDPNDRRS